jgi:molybdate transport system substrate-binding protein
MRTEAHAFLDWLLKPEIQAVMATMGLEPVK